MSVTRSRLAASRFRRFRALPRASESRIRLAAYASRPPSWRVLAASEGPVPRSRSRLRRACSPPGLGRQVGRGSARHGVSRKPLRGDRDTKCGTCGKARRHRRPPPLRPPRSHRGGHSRPVSGGKSGALGAPGMAYNDGPARADRCTKYDTCGSVRRHRRQPEPRPPPRPRGREISPFRAASERRFRGPREA